MAKSTVWDEPINKNTDWGGDNSTNNLPVSGGRVQEFIKNTLNSKMGCVYNDSVNNRNLVFADIEARDLYLQNPSEHMNLVLGTFEAGGGGAGNEYVAEINLISKSFNAISKGTTGNYIQFTFDTKNSHGQSVNEAVTCTFTFVRGSYREVVTKKFRAGITASLNIDEYLKEGTNTITIQLIGQTTLASTIVGVTYQVIDLVLEDNVNIAKVYNSIEDANIEIPYNIAGTGVKTMEWYLDGVLIPYVKSEDEITELETSRIKYIPLKNVAEGVHTLQYRASVVVNGEKFYSGILYRDIIVHNYAGTDNMVAVGTKLPSTANIIEAGQPLKLYGVSQYMAYPLNIGVFNPTYASSTPLEIYVDSALVATLQVQNDIPVTYNLLITSYGEKTIKLKTANSEYNIGVDVEKSETSIEELTQSLTLALSATGKTNASADKDSWTYGSYATTFNNFKWLETCGWGNNALIISEGASIEINYAPLASNAVNTGKTIEFEFSTSNISDNDAVICDLRGENGAGILITASEASLISAGGAKVSIRYKAGENRRIGFVINRSTGVANKTLIMLYDNGILSGAATYAANDNFISNKEIKITSENNVTVSLEDIRIYDIALSSNQMLNNFILYRKSSEEFLKIYDRNDVYEEGTSNFSTDKLLGQLPVMIITGNIPALEATTDKNLQIDVDVEYTNLQDTTRNFSIKNGAMRPQGTSSMSYPKKNFRLYTQKKDNTILYDADGNVVESKLYAFKSGSQPVNCWCFKADYAESSGTHNTGIARLWNDVIRNFQINGEYKGRTLAQTAALAANYSYDVRTCIDGFPILMFYRLSKDSPLVFIGKYNFNNDKSTESVFGFKDIPGFDNTNVQCWEVLNNGHHLALFEDTVNWDSEWADAFEGRYPDGNENVEDLERFADWMSTVTQDEFATQKWQHLDVYKVAAYYIYLMRFGAVDQVVKNAMFTTEDGEHWFFINYDNDTVNGLRNDGLLIYSPTITRQTLDTSFGNEVYAYAGHDSRLWNTLEADSEFMSIVREVDQALYVAGLSYDNVIKTFDDKQSDKWCERIYNQDAQYKYIGPFADRGVNNLFMLQGSRQSHRKWWLSERFSLMDAKFVSGEYKANSFEVKLAGAPIGLTFSIKAGAPLYYGYGVNNVPIESGIELAKGGTHTFTTTSVLNVGDPLRIYAAPYLEEIDISNFATYLAQISIANVYSSRLGTRLKKLIVGHATEENHSLTELSGINQATALTELDIDNCKALTTLDLSNNQNLTKLYAQTSGITSVVLPKSAPIDMLKLPGSLQALSINGLHNLQDSGLTISDGGCNLTTIEILDCPKIDTKYFVQNFLTFKNAADNLCSVTIDGVNWTNVEADWLIRLGNLRHVSLKGRIELTGATTEQVTKLYDIFGNNCFSTNSELYIKIPDGIYIVGPDNVRGMTNTKYYFIVAGFAGSSELKISGTPDLITINNGYLQVGDIVEDTNVLLMGIFTDGTTGQQKLVNKTVTCTKVIYPSSGSISGKQYLGTKGTENYELNLVQDYDSDAVYKVDWQLTGEAVTNGCIALSTTSKNSAIVIINKLEDSSAVLSASVKRASNNEVLVTIEHTISVVNGIAILKSAEKPSIMQICYSKGWCASPQYMKDTEAAVVTEVDFADFTECTDTDFDEFVYFVNAKIVNFFEKCPFKNITIPCETLDIGYNDKEYANKVEILHAPNLKKLIFNGKTYAGYVYCFKGEFLKEIDAPLLEAISNKDGSDFIPNYGFGIITKPSINISEGYIKINLPKFSLNGEGKLFFGGRGNLYIKQLNLNSIRVLLLSSDLIIEEDSIINLDSLEFVSNNNIIQFSNSYILNLPKCKETSVYISVLGDYKVTIEAPVLDIWSSYINTYAENGGLKINGITNCSKINGIIPKNCLSGDVVFPNLKAVGDFNLNNQDDVISYTFKQRFNGALYFFTGKKVQSLTFEGDFDHSIHTDDKENNVLKTLIFGGKVDISSTIINLNALEKIIHKNLISKYSPNHSNNSIVSFNSLDGSIKRRVTFIAYVNEPIDFFEHYFYNEVINCNAPINNMSIAKSTDIAPPNHVTVNGKINTVNLGFYNTTVLQTFTYNYNVAPIMDITKIDDFTTPTDGVNRVIYTQVGTTGFDTPEWVAFCEKFGFTISYTLPATTEETEE